VRVPGAPLAGEADPSCGATVANRSYRSTRSSDRLSEQDRVPAAKDRHGVTIEAPIARKRLLRLADQEASSLKIDPTFDPLRGNPRFQRLVAGG
jgi:hypothetical protein